MNNKLFIIGILSIIILLSGCFNNEKTNAIYLIPEGYTGHAMAFYDVKGAPQLTYEGDFAVHIINEEGYFATSKSDMTYGTVTDQYYFVDENGTRTLADNRCIRVLGTGGYESYGEGDEALVDIKYTGIVITEDCSDEFPYAVDNFEDEKKQATLNRVLDKYYSIQDENSGSE
ncbi:DUF6843 domain-containing protein [Sporosarcina beigongshangi]|uniref:DUF6843 domain-containing protein n=1 Tax=Sporosarcina beigongshangi TaxID=2782538 RepID=UPI00193A31B2|nr:hypothetical protein [Sporosarcina beigongshangi]